MTDADVPEKIYWSIGEVAAMYGVNTSLIRYWEKEFSIIKPHKNKKGDRMFTREDVKNFGLIYHLVKERGFTLQGAREKLRKNPEETVEHAEIVASLKSIREFLVQMRKSIDESAGEEQQNDQ